MTKDEVKAEAEWISEFYFVECCQCGIDFASPLLNKRLTDGETFYCPVGHEQFFGNAREQRDRKRLEQKRKLVEEEEMYRMMHPAPKEEISVPKKKGWFSR